MNEVQKQGCIDSTKLTIEAANSALKSAKEAAASAELAAETAASVIPEIGPNSTWVIKNVDTGKPSRGASPVVGPNGNWWYEGVDSGYPSIGENTFTKEEFNEAIANYPTKQEVNSADNAIAKSISDEIALRLAGDNALQTAINAEAKIREDAINNVNRDAAMLSGADFTGKVTVKNQPKDDTDVVRLVDIKLDTLYNGTALFQDRVFSDVKMSTSFPALVTGSSMFRKSNLQTFTGGLNALEVGSYMFTDSTLHNFSAQLPSLTDGRFMFCNTKLETAVFNTPALVYGNYMFYNTFVSSFAGDLGMLEDGSYMFSETHLSSFDTAMPKLATGTAMFMNTPLAVFKSEVNELIIGDSMFKGTSVQRMLSAFPSLTQGASMYESTPLIESPYILPNIVNARAMYKNCSLLVRLNIDNDAPVVNYSKLIYADNMLDGCSALPVEEIDKLIAVLPSKPAGEKDQSKYVLGVRNCRPGYNEELAISKGWTLAK